MKKILKIFPLLFAPIIAGCAAYTHGFPDYPDYVEPPNENAATVQFHNASFSEISVITFKNGEQCSEPQHLRHGKGTGTGANARWLPMTQYFDFRAKPNESVTLGTRSRSDSVNRIRLVCNLTITFTPKEKANYVVRYQLDGSQCGMRVFQIVDSSDGKIEIPEFSARKRIESACVQPEQSK